MTLPNFLLVGAAKSGTTSLYGILRQHPEIFMPETKEPCFFVDWTGGIRNQSEYEKLFSPGQDFPARGEASTPYLFDAEAPAKIKALLPEVKILIILRNPADMAFSLWRMMRRLGRHGEKLSFASALAEEECRISDPKFSNGSSNYIGNFYYFHRGLYCQQVKRYLELFGRDRVRVLLFEEFKKNPLVTVQEIYRFLGVQENFTPKIEKSNRGTEVRHRGLEKRLRGTSHLLGKILQKLNQKPLPVMDPTLRQNLLEKFRPSIGELEKLLGKDLAVWG